MEEWNGFCVNCGSDNIECIEEEPKTFSLNKFEWICHDCKKNFEIEQVEVVKR